MTIVIVILAWVLAAFFLLGLLGGPFLIGKTRKPYTAGVVVLNSIIGAITIALLVTLAVTL